MLNRNRVVGLVLIAVLLLAAAPAVLGAFSPEVFAIDQAVIDDTVNITRATVGEAGWVVVHADEDGAPGAVLGYTALPSGINANVKVTLDPSGVTETLYAMLHVDAGASGEFEPDGADVPVERNGEPLVKSFAVTGEESTVVKVLAEDERFSTLVEAIEAAGLTDALRKEKEVTIFAPTNDAFAAVGADALNALLADPTQLSNVLLYHVVPSVVMAADISDGEVETLQGAPLTLAVTDGAVTVNDVPVVEADLSGYNGVIHVIDSVLLPPAEEPAAEGDSAAAAVEAETPASIVDVLAADETFSTLAEVISAAGLDEALSGEGPFTLFAPNNDAFAALPADELDALLADPEQLAALLQYHVVEGAILAADVTDGMNAPSLGGQPLTFAVKDDGVYVNDAEVVTPDLLTGNGVVHGIDRVLLPPVQGVETATELDATAAPTGATVADAAAAAGDFTALLKAVEVAGLSDALAGEGLITLFAPTDAAFAALPAGALDALLADPEALKDVLLYHVVLDKLLAEQLPAEGIASSAQGGLLVFSIRADGGVSVNSAPIVQADIEADNGIIQVIDRVLLPPQKAGEAATEEAAAAATEEAATEVAAAVATPEPTAVPTVVPTATAAPAATSKPTNTPAPTATNTALPTNTATTEPTNTPAPTATNTPLPTNTATVKPTNTPIPTATNTPAPTATPEPTNTATVKPTNTPAPTATNTPLPTNTATVKPTNTPIPTATNTPAPTSTPLPTNTPAPTATNTMAPTSTAVPTEAATEAPTEAATEEATEAPTEEAAATEVTVEASAAVTTEATSEAVAVITIEVTPAATAEATAAMTEEATAEATPEATAEMTEEATAEAMEEAATEATVEPAAEATAVMMEEATVAATPEATVTETPAEMPTSGGELSGGSLTLAVVAGVLAALMGGAFVTRRRAA